jgi:hypothetical protein
LGIFEHWGEWACGEGGTWKERAFFAYILEI